jgi:hypothetical protein
MPNNQGLPEVLYEAVSLAASARGVYALRDDGAVFVLARRGDNLPNGEIVQDPRWVHVPAVPGTVAAYEQAGKAAT